uniref:Uncharacterized protein n=1 Tax=Anguilla anguilla TaxID=7936 RepID=A0A0E9WIH8_ANGAN
MQGAPTADTARPETLTLCTRLQSITCDPMEVFYSWGASLHCETCDIPRSYTKTRVPLLIK